MTTTGRSDRRCYRRLKCDRKEPCGNCVAREFDCVYASYTRGRRAAQHPRGGGGDDGRQLQLDARIRQLEKLINTMATANNSSGSGSNQEAARVPTKSPDHGGDGQPVEFEPGRIESTGSQMTYVSSTHWASVCNEVAEIRQHLDEVRRLDDEGQSPDPRQDRGPMLLEGIRMISSVQDALPSVPPKHVADKLISRYFNAAEVAICAWIHA